jgi:hypothetical protein
VTGQFHAPAALPSGKYPREREKATRPLERSRSGRERNLRPPPEIVPRLSSAYNRLTFVMVTCVSIDELFNYYPSEHFGSRDFPCLDFFKIDLVCTSILIYKFSVVMLQIA